MKIVKYVRGKGKQKKPNLKLMQTNKTKNSLTTNNWFALLTIGLLSLLFSCFFRRVFYEYSNDFLYDFVADFAPFLPLLLPLLLRLPPNSAVAYHVCCYSHRMSRAGKFKLRRSRSREYPNRYSECS